jgi:hypothetical protein
VIVRRRTAATRAPGAPWLDELRRVCRTRLPNAPAPAFPRRRAVSRRGWKRTSARVRGERGFANNLNGGWGEVRRRDGMVIKQ